MLNSFLQDMEDLRQRIRSMVMTIEENIRDSVMALKTHNRSLAELISQRDKVVDATSHQVESELATLLALHQPMAKDLRLIIAYIRLNIDLERISDLTVSIAHIAIKTLNEEHIKPLVDIPKMAEVCVEMLEGCMEQLSDGDAEEIIAIARRDDEIDQMYDQVRRELITYMIEDPHTIRNASDLMYVARSLERIGDHITNVCESMVYAIDGRRLDLNN
ncbi:MAG: phosphate signaling complex protein PhoU [Methermicoccaceae archaeon]